MLIRRARTEFWIAVRVVATGGESIEIRVVWEVPRTIGAYVLVAKAYQGERKGTERCGIHRKGKTPEKRCKERGQRALFAYHAVLCRHRRRRLSPSRHMLLAVLHGLSNPTVT